MHFSIRSIVSIIRQPLVLFIGGFCCIVLLTLLIFRQIGSWLLVVDPVPPSIDVVCTFAGENNRVEYSKNLMLAYPDAHWVLSDYKNGYGRLLQKNNFDMTRVSVIDTCKSTLSEVTAFAAWLAVYRKKLTNDGVAGPVSVVLVSSPYHMRRIKIMAQRRIKDTTIALHFLPVPLDKYLWSEDTFRYWWRSNEIVSITTLELVKLGYFMLTGYF